MNNDNFIFIPKTEWLISTALNRTRRHALLQNITFQEIIQRIIKKSEILDYKFENKYSQPAYRRILITLEMPPETVDLFHNSCCGYRAQYYYSKEKGEEANKYALKELTPYLLNRIGNKKKEMVRDLNWIKKSLLDPHAKLWIDQGIWYRLRKFEDRNILVKRWAEEHNSKNARYRKLALYASLSASDERRIDIKGGYLDSNGNSLNKGKKERSEEIHTCGYT